MDVLSTPARPDRPKPPSTTKPTTKPTPKYVQPLPVRTFPLPAFFPHNPVSLVHLVVAWLGQALGTPEPVRRHVGVWTPVTRSVHVTNPAAMRALWTQGFFGKGSLSRSEPSWLAREHARVASASARALATSEQRTDRRRAERADAKWERGRLALEALEKTRLAEAVADNGAEVEAEVDETANSTRHESCSAWKAPVGPLELLALPNSAADLARPAALAEPQTHKTVRFAPAEAPAPAKDKSASLAADEGAETVPAETVPAEPRFKPLTKGGPPAPTIANKEHLQLAPEEALFLAYAVGALHVVDAAGRAVPPTALLSLFAAQTPGFLAHYAVYHHFRSLGWTPRHGIKFGVDWMLYGKGPALDHAEFGVLVLTKETVKTWHWLHSANRVLSTVYKSMVLVYVDVPPVDLAAVTTNADITALLRTVRIREVMVKRWSSNRNRD